MHTYGRMGVTPNYNPKSMNQWFTRWWQRENDLRAGIDADLVHFNRLRYKRGFACCALGFVLLFLADHASSSHVARTLIGVAGGSLSLAGLILLQWSARECAFLHKPDPEEPPSILKQ